MTAGSENNSEMMSWQTTFAVIAVVFESVHWQRKHLRNQCFTLLQNFDGTWNPCDSIRLRNRLVMP